MKTSEEIISKLKEHQSPTPSKWRENAEWRLKNRAWLRYSQHIAMMMLDKMEELNMSQKKLSELMGCSQQYVSKVLKGQENLSLETISKIERSLGLQIMPIRPRDTHNYIVDAEDDGAIMVAEDRAGYGNA